MLDPVTYEKIVVSIYITLKTEKLFPSTSGLFADGNKE